MSLLSVGLTSRIGVPSTASRLRTRTRSPSIDKTATRCSPIGFGPIGRTGAEHALLFSRGVAPRMHAQDVAARTVEPGEDDHFVPDVQTLQALEDRRLEREPRVRRPLITLLRGRRKIGRGIQTASASPHGVSG